MKRLRVKLQVVWLNPVPHDADFSVFAEITQSIGTGAIHQIELTL